MTGAPCTPRGIDHVALVCRDMAATVRIYRDVLGLALVETIELDDVEEHVREDLVEGAADVLRIARPDA